MAYYTFCHILQQGPFDGSVPVCPRGADRVLGFGGSGLKGAGVQGSRIQGSELRVHGAMHCAFLRNATVLPSSYVVCGTDGPGNIAPKDLTEERTAVPLPPFAMSGTVYRSRLY
eukprot:2505953-Rhodomonas_salina.3